MPSDLLASESIEVESRPKEGGHLSVQVQPGGSGSFYSNKTSDDEIETQNVTPPPVFSTSSRDEDADANVNNDANSRDSPMPTSPSSTSAISWDEIKFGCSSYHAMFTPVAITMILSALAVTYIQTPSLRSEQTDALSNSYTVFDVSDGAASNNSKLANLGMSLVNGLIIVSVIGAMTFVIVILYKYRCMKIIMGYMVLSSALLLGFMGGYMFHIYLHAYGIVMDYITFLFLIINFAVVGTVAIFFGRGSISPIVTQIYLVATSVILAWQLSHFNEWTAWTLLVLLALYDLCAVLTPCGPLKALIKLMQRDNSPDLPGLLYEARLPTGVSRPSNSNATATATATGGNNHASSSHNSGVPDTRTQPPSRDAATSSNGNQRTMGNIDNRSRQNDGASGQEPPPRRAARPQIESSTTGRQSSNSNRYYTGTLPFAICKIYKLQVPRDNCPAFVLEKYNPRDLANGTGPRPTYSTEELKTEVTVLFPRNGGRIIVERPEEANESSRKRRSRYNGETLKRFIVEDPNGDIKRVLVMKDTGKVYEEVNGSGGNSPDRSGDGEMIDNERDNNTIKLGLGDFIFYSVLVSKAAMYSFTTFAACTLTILAGLGGTLVLLSVYHAALPALPISIFLGVIFYFVTRALVEPWIEEIMFVPFYV